MAHLRMLTTLAWTAIFIKLNSTGRHTRRKLYSSPALFSALRQDSYCLFEFQKLIYQSAGLYIPSTLLG